MPFRNRYALVNHYERHGEEFQGISLEEYKVRAETFLTGELPTGIRECRRANKDVIRFNPMTHELGIIAADGIIRTFMIANPLPCENRTPEQYYESLCRQ